MEEHNEQRNMVVLDGEITRIFERKSEKAPTTFKVKCVERWGDDNVRTNFIDCKAFNFPADITTGDIVHMIGGIRSGSYEKDGTKVYTQELFFNKIEKTGRNAAADEDIPSEIPDGEINFDEIPF